MILEPESVSSSLKFPELTGLGVELDEVKIEDRVLRKELKNELLLAASALECDLLSKGLLPVN